MHDHHFYGTIDNLWIFLRAETVDMLTRLWAALGSSTTWGELRESVGDQMTGA
jgi:hypothetical protein